MHSRPIYRLFTGQRGYLQNILEIKSERAVQKSVQRRYAQAELGEALFYKGLLLHQYHRCLHKLQEFGLDLHYRISGDAGLLYLHRWTSFL